MTKIQLYKAESYQKLHELPFGAANCLITDPPYSSGGAFRADRMMSTSSKYQMNGTERTYEDFEGDNRDQRSWGYWCTMWLLQCYRILPVGSPVCVFTDWRMLPTLTDSLQAAGFVWRGIVPWDKTEGARPDTGRFRNQAEYVVWGSKGPMPLDRLDHAKTRVLPGVIRTPVRQADKFHLTGKPTPLMCQLVKITEPGGVILDPFMGSGTTGVAAKLEGFGFIGIESGEGNFNTATLRLGEVPISTPTTSISLFNS